MECCLRSCRSTRSTASPSAVGALRARLRRGKLIARFDCPKLKGHKMATLAAMTYVQADHGVVLAAADGGGVRVPALERRFIDYANSPDQVLPFDLFVLVAPFADATPHSPRGKAPVIIDLLARGDDVVNKLYQCAFELKHSRSYDGRDFPFPLR